MPKTANRKIVKSKLTRILVLNHYLFLIGKHSDGLFDTVTPPKKNFTVHVKIFYIDNWFYYWFLSSITIDFNLSVQNV